MKPEQLKWTDKEWASHLQWDVHDIPYLRTWVSANYFPGIALDKNNGCFVFCLDRIDFAPSGATRFRPVTTLPTKQQDKNKAIKVANEEIIPSLELAPFISECMCVPSRILQMLHIDEKQK